jgi:3-methyladenine DNA glycosylase/8-oxoguanine DNA glycosylase
MQSAQANNRRSKSAESAYRSNEISQAWRPYRTWAAVHLRALREQRTGEIAGR